MTNSTCPLPTKQVDEQYKKLISEYRKIGPKDASFQEAIEDLMRFTPTTATRALIQCDIKGGRKNQKSRFGGASASKKLCYIKALSKITMGVAGLGAAGYYYLMPFVASATGSPCAGLTDQAMGFLGGWIDPTLSCAYRQKAFDDMAMNYITNIAKLTGISVGAAILKAPKAFKAIIKYLAARECPELFDNYSLEDLKKDLSSEQSPAAKASIQSQSAISSAPGYEREEVRQEFGSYGQYYDEPEDTVPSRRSSRRTRRGGRKQRKQRQIKTKLRNKTLRRKTLRRKKHDSRKIKHHKTNRRH